MSVPMSSVFSCVISAIRTLITTCGTGLSRSAMTDLTRSKFLLGREDHQRIGVGVGHDEDLPGQIAGQRAARRRSASAGVAGLRARTSNRRNCRRTIRNCCRSPTNRRPRLRHHRCCRSLNPCARRSAQCPGWCCGSSMTNRGAKPLLAPKSEVEDRFEIARRCVFQMIDEDGLFRRRIGIQILDDAFDHFQRVRRGADHHRIGPFVGRGRDLRRLVAFGCRRLAASAATPAAESAAAAKAASAQESRNVLSPLVARVGLKQIVESTSPRWPRWRTSTGRLSRRPRCWSACRAPR